MGDVGPPDLLYNLLVLVTSLPWPDDDELPARRAFASRGSVTHEPLNFSSSGEGSWFGVSLVAVYR